MSSVLSPASPGAHLAPEPNRAKPSPAAPLATPASSAGAAQPGSSAAPRAAARADLMVVAALTLATFALACVFEFHEALTSFTRPLEVWQLDELPIALVALAAGLAWYAFRRAADAHAQLRLREHAQAQALNLLAHNRELARQLLGVQESERRALARELHDELGPHCHAIRVEAAYLQRCEDPAQARSAVLRTAANAQALVGNVHSLLRRLRPAELDELGLPAALQALCEAWEERSAVSCVFHHTGLLDDLGEDADTALYRVTQEALTNVMRHAGATQVRIQLRRGAAEVDLRIEDDGRGFDPAADTPGLGLLGATERAAALGATLHVDSAPGRGTRLRMHIPLRCA
jgi:signal transduction histidine kinase